MKEVILIYKLANNFVCKESSSYQMSILAEFLTNDVKCSNYDFYKVWANNDQYDSSGGDYSSLEKRGDNIIIMEDWAEEEDPFIEMPKISFIHILDEWGRICKDRPKEVLITRDGDNFIFEKKS